MNKTVIIKKVFACVLCFLLPLNCFALEKGNRGDDVLALQTRLYDLGFYNGEFTGYYGDNTYTAIRNFQIANNIEPTGIADANTVKALNSENAVDKDAYLQSVFDADFEEISIKLNDENDLVLNCKKALINLGYIRGKASKVFDEETEAAVKEFQLLNGLKVTGIIDNDTYAKLLSPDATGKNVKSDTEDALALKEGSSGVLVKELQKALTNLGFFTGEITGNYGTATKAAISAFQQSNGLAETGIADSDTLLYLAGNNALSKEEALELYSVRTLTNGDVDEAVEVLEKQLKTAGFFTSQPDTTYDDETAQAVGVYQKANGLEPTGTADSVVRYGLNLGTYFTYDEYLETQTTVSCKLNDTGVTVKLLKEKLTELGYFTEEANESFDAALELSVKDFQQANNIKVTGIADTQTRKLMYEDEVINKEASIQIERAEKAVEQAIKLVASEERFTDQSLIEYYCAENKASLENTKEIQEYSLLKCGDIIYLSAESGIYLGGGKYLHTSNDKPVISVIEDDNSNSVFVKGIRPYYE